MLVADALHLFGDALVDAGFGSVADAAKELPVVSRVLAAVALRNAMVILAFPDLQLSLAGFAVAFGAVPYLEPLLAREFEAGH